MRRQYAKHSTQMMWVPVKNLPKELIILESDFYIPFFFFTLFALFFNYNHWFFDLFDLIGRKNLESLWRAIIAR